MSNNPCTKCGKPGIPGLIQGVGKCQYHWNVGAFGKEWADQVEQDRHSVVADLLREAMPHLPGELQRRVRAALEG